MRWIDRGPEPEGVAGYANQFTPGWVDYFQRQIGGRPTDSYWRAFRSVLRRRSDGNCWYCERRCEPAAPPSSLGETVDHFKPLHHFPELAYEWSNWIFGCYRCNVENKQDKWPADGYVDPCAASIAERPEQYFDYDIASGNVIPRSGLSDDARRKALDTIDDLGLNKLDVRFYRLERTREFVSHLREFSMADRQAFIDFYASQPMEYAGIIAMVVSQMKEAGEV